MDIQQLGKRTEVNNMNNNQARLAVTITKDFDFGETVVSYDAVMPADDNGEKQLETILQGLEAVLLRCETRELTRAEDDVPVSIA